ncbi:MAG TPA: acyclic terpene utilization AtuA family protein, partial [Steroidobacteraceae bacterium]
MADVLRIGCGCGFWGDSAQGPAQLVAHGNIDVLVLDYLSEITLSLLARARRRRPELGYTPDFISEVMRPLAPQLAARGIKVVANAGGVNPQACRAALQAVLDELGVRLNVAVVLGDDISARLDALRAAGVTDMETGGELPANVASANAYLGAFPIAQALAAGADVVITGRCADSAMALAPLIHAFNWQPGDYDRLALGSLAGHIIECGPQATGGIFTDWRASAADWDDIGYPIVECAADGSFVVTKTPASGGLVTPATVAEQVTYEVHDPARYILPDVVCDFRAIQLVELGADRVGVRGAHGLPATSTYKASLTYADGFRCTATLMIVGAQAVQKAEAVGAAIVKRTRRAFQERGWQDYRAVSIEVLGAESMYGPHARTRDTREVILKIAVAHASEAPLELFAREIFPSASSMAQGITGFAGGRPAVQPVVRLASCLIAKSSVPVTIEINGSVVPADAGSVAGAPAAPVSAGAEPGAPAQPPAAGPQVEVPLVRLAHGRSGDKGDTA